MLFSVAFCRHCCCCSLRIVPIMCYQKCIISPRAELTRYVYINSSHTIHWAGPLLSLHPPTIVINIAVACQLVVHSVNCIWYRLLRSVSRRRRRWWCDTWRCVLPTMAIDKFWLLLCRGSSSSSNKTKSQIGQPANHWAQLPGFVRHSSTEPSTKLLIIIALWNDVQLRANLHRIIKETNRQVGYAELASLL